jgi:hypothetical protein
MARILESLDRGEDGFYGVAVETRPPLRFTALLRDAARPEELGALKALEGRLPHRLLVVAPHLTPRAAQRARELDLAVVDLAGNVHLNGPGALVFVVGRKRAPGQPQPQTRRGTTPGGLRVTFNLLTQPGLVEAPYREIAQAAGVALGTVGAAMEDLARRGHVRAGRGGGRELLDPGRLAEEWTVLYPVRLRPKLKPRRFGAPEPHWWRGAILDPREAVLGGEAAAELLTGHLKATTVTLYAKKPIDAVVLAHRLRPDEDGEVEILNAFWPLGTLQGGAPTGMTPRLLVIADLLATGDARNVETARLIQGENR